MIPALSACTESPEPGIRTRSTTSAIADHLDLALARADRLEEDDVLAGGVDEEQRLRASPRRARRGARACPSSGCRPRVEEVVDEPDAVAEERAARERARRVDRDDAARFGRATATCATSALDERRLADSGRPGDADRGGAGRSRDRRRGRSPRPSGDATRRARSHARARVGRRRGDPRRAPRASSRGQPPTGLYGLLRARVCSPPPGCGRRGRPRCALAPPGLLDLVHERADALTSPPAPRRHDPATDTSRVRR